MNLCRPISVVAGTRPPSIYDILKDDETLEKTLTSFYLPRDTVKALHVTRYFIWTVCLDLCSSGLLYLYKDYLQQSSKC
jgi:hypothetical protein